MNLDLGILATYFPTFVLCTFFEIPLLSLGQGSCILAWNNM
jgi:hypothetical protein